MYQIVDTGIFLANMKIQSIATGNIAEENFPREYVGTCKCEVICNDWVTFALRILWRTRYGDAAETVCEEGFLADVAKCA